MHVASPLIRCAWAKREPLIGYHDREWGVPLHDEQRLFEFLILEGAQAGLSWETILKKRDAYRRAFDDFDPVKIAGYSDAKLTALISDPGIVRNRLKIAAAVHNARAYLELQGQFGSFDGYLWRFVDGRPVHNHWSTPAEVPSKTEVSDALSKDLSRRGFKFVGSTICYAFMQATGMVDDHTQDCFRYQEREHA